jgi:hypothetical protein
MKSVITFILLGLTATQASAQGIDPLSFLEGTWCITKVRYYPHIHALSDEEAAAFEGRILTYFASAVTNGKCSCSSPTYAIQTWEPDKFESFSRFHLTKIGLKDDEPVLRIDIECADGEGIGLGGYAIIMDSDTIFTMTDGVYFVTRR